MSTASAVWVVALVAVYALAGLVFAVPFLVRGVTRIDHAAHGTSLTFRLVILPGVVVLWPVLLRQWMRGGS